MNKLSLRKKLIRLRKKNYSKNFSISSNSFFNLLEKKKLKSKIIGGYYPFNYEFEILNILEELEKKNYTFSLPKISNNNEMNFYKWSKTEPLKVNKYGIPEPISNTKVYPKILLIPLVGFDYHLNRLGYGGGYYDRFLSKKQNKNELFKIGVGFSFQKVKSIPIDKYDKKLDCVMTEKVIIE